MPPATPERPTGADETVRYRPEGADDGAPPAVGAAPAGPSGEFDDTRPVSRDWRSGAPPDVTAPPDRPASPDRPADGSAPTAADDATERPAADDATERPAADDA
ncbi:hypothetical protein OF117_01845, partial [Geodermatophilus sp. YIM 151500]|nr:hypothetical protein [Geodermatophilus sp. YIM 151500]